MTGQKIIGREAHVVEDDKNEESPFSSPEEKEKEKYIVFKK